MVRSKVTNAKSKKCPVCEKNAGAGTFECVGCSNWVHPRCGDYKVKFLQDPTTDPKMLMCKKCKKTPQVDREETVNASASVMSETNVELNTLNSEQKTNETANSANENETTL